jgi:hypothetical protein
VAAFFTAASSQYLSTTPYVTAVPFTVAMWIRLTAASTVQRILWAASDSATAHSFFVRMDAAEQVAASIEAGAGASSAEAATAITAGVWNFVIARYISATNRRVALRHGNGLIQHASDATNTTPTGINTETIGARVISGAAAAQFWNGSIAEFWQCNQDIGPDAASALPDPMVNQLAFGGPFSMPQVAGSLVHYRSFRAHPTAAHSEDVFYGAGGIREWTNNAAVATGDHPPLPYWYENPGQRRRILTV